MNPIFATLTFAAAWLIAIFFAWAFVHGAQKLRRKEVASLIAAEQERAARDKPAIVTSITPETNRLPEAA